jgi:hypothetical protein
MEAFVVASRMLKAQTLPVTALASIIHAIAA